MKKSKMPSIVSVLILTFITVVVWVTFDVYRLFNQPAIPVVPEAVSRPITPSLDEQAINQLESRIFVDSSQIPDDVVISGATTEPTTTTQPTPNPVGATNAEQ